MITSDAYSTLRKFWDIQDGGDYSQLSELFSDEAVLVDPIYGTFEGRPAIAKFMTKMNEEMAKIGASFRLEAIAGDHNVAWAQWIATTNDGERSGVGVYRVMDGQITYYRDYMNEAVSKPAS